MIQTCESLCREYNLSNLEVCLLEAVHLLLHLIVKVSITCAYATLVTSTPIPNLCPAKLYYVLCTAYKEVTSLAQFKTILKHSGDKLVVVDFTASWYVLCVGVFI